MSRELTHEEFRAIAPELALGIAIGEERADALRHAGGCIDCRAHLDELSQVADGLLLLVPDREPPVGFESKVLSGFASPERGPWLRRHAGAVAAALVAACIAAAFVFVVTESDRDIAASYRETLAVANGEYFSAAPLTAADGSRAGLVYIYQGDPSWAFVYVESGATATRYDVELVTRGGRTISAGVFEPTAGTGSWGRATPIAVRDVVWVRLVEGDRVAFHARVH